MELRTLKDFEFKVDSDGNVCNLDDLRQKAIKWVKEDDNLIKDNTIFTMSSMELFDFLQDRWMKRLNITEEDLEEKK